MLTEQSLSLSSPELALTILAQRQFWAGLAMKIIAHLALEVSDESVLSGIQRVSLSTR